jgi:hypothetical protein
LIAAVNQEQSTSRRSKKNQIISKMFLDGYVLHLTRYNNPYLFLKILGIFINSKKDCKKKDSQHQWASHPDVM